MEIWAVGAWIFSHGPTHPNESFFKMSAMFSLVFGIPADAANPSSTGGHNTGKQEECLDKKVADCFPSNSVACLSAYRVMCLQCSLQCALESTRLSTVSLQKVFWLQKPCKIAVLPLCRQKLNKTDIYDFSCCRMQELTKTLSAIFFRFSGPCWLVVGASGKIRPFAPSVWADFESESAIWLWHSM